MLPQMLTTVKLRSMNSRMRSIAFAIGLVLFFLMGFGAKPVKVLLAGDSTMADKPLTKSVKDTVSGETFEEPFLERGWGQLLPQFLNENAGVLNYARNGRSSRTFVEEGLWTELINNAGKGDFVIIQFGHNDEVPTKKSYTEPAQFRLNFVAFVNEVRAKGAYPILCTSVARRKFDEQGNLVATHDEYPEIIRAVAKQENVPLIDMERITSEWLQNAGVEKSKSFFHKIAPGVSKLYPKGLDDDTHFNEKGAASVAEFFIREVERQDIREFLKLIKK